MSHKSTPANGAIESARGFARILKRRGGAKNVIPTPAKTGGAMPTEQQQRNKERQQLKTLIEDAAKTVANLSTKEREESIEADLEKLFPDLYRIEATCPARDVTHKGMCRFATAKGLSVATIILHLNDDHKTWKTKKIAEWVAEVNDPLAKAMMAAWPHVRDIKGHYVLPLKWGRPDADALGCAWLACKATGLC